VMYAGRYVEEAAIDDLFARPRHPYTVGLLQSIPRLDDAKELVVVSRSARLSRSPQVHSPIPSGIAAISRRLRSKATTPRVHSPLCTRPYRPCVGRARDGRLTRRHQHRTSPARLVPRCYTHLLAGDILEIVGEN
jgi:oligopeptide/dipeptide ABC transporter ATP-binding protein